MKNIKSIVYSVLKYLAILFYAALGVLLIWFIIFMFQKSPVDSFSDQAIRFIVTSYERPSDKVKHDLNVGLYDMIEESFINYGDISESEYKDIVSPEYYDFLYYLSWKNEDQSSGKNYIDRSDYDILISYHSMPETDMISGTEAVSTYYIEYKFAADKPFEEREGHRYYDRLRYALGKSTITIKWELQNDKKWHIVDYIQSV